MFTDNNLPSPQETSRTLFSEQDEIEYWESIYDRQDFLGFCYRARMNQALSWLDNADISGNSIILDAGCGTGVVTQGLAQRGYRVLGLDSSDAMLCKADRVCNTFRRENIQLMQGDVHTLPFRDSSIDAVVCLGVITYSKSEVKVLQELSRVLKPDGILILSILSKSHLAYYLDVPRFIKNRLTKVLSNRSVSLQNTEEKQSFTIRRYLISSISKSLNKLGLTVTEYKTVPLGLLTFFNRELPPEKLNMKITLLLERFRGIPLVGSFGGMCLFKAIKKKDSE